MGYLAGDRKRARQAAAKAAWRARKAVSDASAGQMPFALPSADSVSVQSSHAPPPAKRARVQTVFFGKSLVTDVESCTHCCQSSLSRVADCVDSAPLDVRNNLPLHARVDEQFSGLGAMRAAVRALNAEPRRDRRHGADFYEIVAASDGNVPREWTRKRDKQQMTGPCPPKTALYNDTLLPGEVRARDERIESRAALKHAERLKAPHLRPLLCIAGISCRDISVMGKGAGLLRGPSASGVKGFFARMDVTDPPLVIIEEVASFFSAKHQASLRSILTELKKRGFHFRFCVLNSSRVSPQKRKRAYIVASKNPRVLAAFRWPRYDRTKVREVKLRDCMEREGEAPKECFINVETKVGRALESGLRRNTQGGLYSRVASVRNGVVRVPANSHAAVPTLTASRGSGLYVWERNMLRRISGYEALRCFTFARDEARAYCEAARARGISSVSLAEYAGDCFVVHVMRDITRALVDAFSATATEEEKQPWLIDRAMERRHDRGEFLTKALVKKRRPHAPRARSTCGGFAATC